MAIDRFGGVIEEEQTTDRFGGIIGDPQTGPEGVGAEGIQYTPEQLREYGTISAEPPAGFKFLEDYARPTTQAIGAGAGAVAGAGVAAPTGPGALLGGVAGGGLGFAIGDEVVDTIENWFYPEDRPQKPLALELKESAEDIRTGLTYELVGHSLIPGAKAIGKGAAWIGGKFTKPGAEKTAGEIIAAMTDKGPLIAKNWEEAQVLEAAMPGLKFDLAQLTGEPGIIKFVQEGVETSADIAARQAEKRVANTEAIQGFIKNSKEAGAGTRELKAPLTKQQRLVQEAEELAKRNMESEVAARKGMADPKETGQFLREEIFTSETAAREAASEKFAAVPEQELIIDDLYDSLKMVMKPKHRTEGKDKFPKVLRDAIKEIEGGPKTEGRNNNWTKGVTNKLYSFKERPATSQAIDIADSSKYTSAQTRARESIHRKKANVLNGDLKGITFEDPRFDELAEKAQQFGMEAQVWREASEILEGAPQWTEEALKSARKSRGKFYREKGYTVGDEIVEPEMTLTDLQGLRSEILEDLRTAKDKGYPASYRSRLNQAVDAIDQKLSMGSTKMPKGEIVYHSSVKKLKGGKPYFDAFYGDIKHARDEGSTGFFGDKKHAMELPLDTKILDISDLNPEAMKFLNKAKALMKDDPITGPPDNPFEIWTGEFHPNYRKSTSDKIKILKEMGYDGAKWVKDDSTEYLLSKDIAKKSQAYNPKTLKPIGGKTPGQEMQEAQKFFREEVIEKYHKGVTKRIIRGEETVEDALVSGQFFKPGAKGQEAAKDFNRALGDNKAAKAALKDTIDQNFLDKVVSPKTGEINKGALNKWLKSHQYALKEYGLEKDYSSFIKARKALDRAQQKSREFDKSIASRVLNADVNDVVKQAFSGKGSRKDAAKELMKFMQRKKPSRDELLYHATDKTIPPGQLKSGYFGGKYHLENEMLEPYGENLYALKPPKETKILDLDSKSENAWGFMDDLMASDPPKDSLEDMWVENFNTLKDRIADRDPEAIFDAASYFMDTRNIPQKLKIAKNRGYDIVKWQDEFLVPESLIKKSQAFNAKTLKPVTGKSKPVKTADMYTRGEKLSKDSKFYNWDVVPEPKGAYTDKQALKGLQNAMIDEILTEAPLGEQQIGDLLTSKQMGDQLRKYDAAIREVFKREPQKVNAMLQVRRAVKKMELTTPLPKGADRAKGTLESMARNYGHSRKTAVSIAADMYNWIARRVGVKDVNNIVNRAILDPELAIHLKNMSRGGKPEKAGIPFINRLIATGLITAP